jgi:hypothetical protein
VFQELLTHLQAFPDLGVGRRSEPDPLPFIAVLSCKASRTHLLNQMGYVLYFENAHSKYRRVRAAFPSLVALANHVTGRFRPD